MSAEPSKSDKVAIAIFARVPELGKVKTRLAKHLGEKEALDFYIMSLSQTVSKCKSTKGVQPFLYCEGPTDHSEIVKISQTYDVPVFSQTVGDLGVKMMTALKVLHASFEKAAILGSDAPTLPTDYLDVVSAGLSQSDVVLGPSYDGGYYLIGANRGQCFDLSDVRWSTQTTMEQTVECATNQNLSVGFLPPWYDVDDGEGYRVLKIEQSL